MNLLSKSLPVSRIGVDFSPMRTGFDNGGAKPFAIDLVREFAQKRPQISFTLFATQGVTDELSRTLPSNVKFFVMDKFSPSGRTMLSFSRRLFRLLPAPLKKFLRILQRHSQFTPDKLQLSKLVEVDLMFYPFTNPLVNYDKNKPSVSVIYDLQHVFFPSYFHPEERAIRQNTFDLVAARADAAVCISDFTRDTVSEYTDVPENILKRVHIQRGRRLEGFVRTKLQPDIVPIADKYILYPANFWLHKNHKFLIVAFAIARSRGLAKNIKLVLTGTQISEGDSIRLLVRRLNLSNVVIFTGYIETAHFAHLMHGAHAMVFPSLFEGFGMPIIEAMCAGVPVACSNVSSLPEVAGEAALYFDPRKPEHIANALMLVCSDSSIREKLKKAARKNVKKFLNPTTMAEEYLDIFDEIVKNRPLCRTQNIESV